VPSIAGNMKARGDKQLPIKLGQSRLAAIAAWSTFNVVLSIALQAGIEVLLTQVFQVRSALRVTTTVPLPWSIAKDLLKAFLLRGPIHYFIHRYILHASPQKSPLAHWHMKWAHSIKTPFSLAASYDHPVCYLLSQWLPLYLPAVMMRMHVLTWLIFLALSSMESLLIYSGYAVSFLPSSILLPGMARRVDAHYATNGKGNYGHWGILDWAFGTSCATGESDIVDDLREESDKHDVRDKMGNAMNDAGDKLKDGGKEKDSGKEHGQRRPERSKSAAKDDQEDEGDEQDEKQEGDSQRNEPRDDDSNRDGQTGANRKSKRKGKKV